MSNNNLKSHKKIYLLVCLLLAVSLNAKKFVYNDHVIISKTEVKIEEMANELYRKTGISAYLLTKKNLNGKSIAQYERNFAKKFKPPYTILSIALDEQKVDIYNSIDLDNTFDREAILSPYPWKGSIIPLLTIKKKYVSVSAAMLNGYADMVEQIAKSKNIKLKSGIGSTNKNIYFSLQLSIFLFLFVVFGWYFIKKLKKR